MTDLIDQHLGIHASALSLRATRARLLANNLVNADTPNYKAKDFDFNTALQKQLQAPQGSMTRTHQRHIGIDQTGKYLASTRIQYRVPIQASLDGNTVDTDMENSAFSENAVRYQASLEFLNKRITGLIRTLKGE